MYPFKTPYPVTRKFGIVDPAYANYPNSAHPGVDYGAPENTPTIAVMSGIVKVYARGNTATGRGNEVRIIGQGIEVRYCHLNEIHVTDGQTIQAGQVIGLVGWTGYVLPKSPKGSHLHFEVLINGVYVDPEKGINMPFISNEEYKDLQIWKQKGMDLEAEKFNILYPKINELTAIVDGLTKERDTVTYPTIERQKSQIKDLQAQLSAQSDDSVNLNALGSALRWLIARLGLKS